VIANRHGAIEIDLVLRLRRRVRGDEQRECKY
jgi:hypothetical protein